MKPVSDQFKSSQCFLVAKLIWIVYTSFQVQKWNLEDSKPMEQITNRLAWIFHYFKSKTSMHAPLEEMQVGVLKNSEWNTVILMQWIVQRVMTAPDITE